MNPTTTPGGKALQYFASIRIHVRAGEKINNPSKKDEVIGHVSVAKVVKNKTAPPFRVAQYPLIYGKGIDRFTEIVDIALTAPWMTKAGAWLRIEENDKPLQLSDGTEAKWNGRDKFQAYLETNQTLTQAISEWVLNGGAFDLERIKMPISSETAPQE